MGGPLCRIIARPTRCQRLASSCARIRLWVHPIALGTGGRLFDGVSPVAMEAESTHTTKAGVTVVTYRVAGRPEFRGFGSNDDEAG